MGKRIEESDRYCFYCDKIVSVNEIGGGTRHKECGYEMHSMRVDPFYAALLKAEREDMTNEKN